MASRLMKDDHHVSMLGVLAQDAGAHTCGATVHDIPAGHPDAVRIIEAARFDAVVFFFAFQCEDTREYGSVQGAMLDALFAMQHASQKSGTQRFILVTDRRVFGREQACTEDETPIPDTPTGKLIKAAEDCMECGVREGMRIMTIRVTSLYATSDLQNFFAFTRKRAQEGAPLILEGNAQTVCDFLHIDDLALFLGSALEVELEGTFHLAYGAKRTYADLEKALHNYLPRLKIEYTNTFVNRATLQTRAVKAVDWVPRHDFLSEMKDLAWASPRQRRHRLADVSAGLGGKFGQRFLPWIEVALLAWVAQWLSDASHTNASFRYVDYWMLFVALMGYMHGGLIGTVSAVVACATYAFSWMAEGNDLYMLLYNVDNWIPLVSYLLTGALFGYISDKHREHIAQLKREKQERDEEAEFLQSIYRQTSEDRDQLQEQVMRYRDSYGRIYQITRKLDSMQPEQVLLSTLDVMEDIMQNQSVSLYSCKPGNAFTRLVVHSRAYTNLPRSLDLDKLPKLREVLEQGKIFANTALDAGYPTFASPIRDENGLVAIVMLWEVPFERQTLYHQNLLSVVTGLVQSAMVSAMRYVNLSDDMYIKDTHILADEAFRSVLSVYQSMRKQRTGSYLLVHLQGETKLSGAEMDAKFAHAMRSTDVAGYLKGSGYYALFPQAGIENLELIAARFSAQGLRCEVVSQEVAYA